MNLFNKVKNVFKRFGNKQNLIIDTRKSFEFNDITLANNETIFAVVSRLSNTMSSLSLELYQNNNIENNNDLANLIEDPNSYMTSFSFINTLETIRNIYGNAYALIEYDSNYTPIALHILDSNNVMPYIEKDSKELYYRILDEQGTIFIHSSNIIHVKYNSTTGIKGVNPLNILRNTLNYDREVKEFSINQMQNGLKANLVIKVQAKLNKEIMDNYTEMLQRFKKNGVLFLDAGKEVQELKNTSFIDPKVFEVENITISRVARVYNVPLYKVLETKKSYSNAEQADLEYVKDTVLPICRQYEKEFNKKLLNPVLKQKGYRFRFNLSSLKRADMTARGDFYFKGIRSGWFTPNEIRALEDFPPAPNGDKLLISRDLIPIDKIDDLIPKQGGENNG